MESQDIQQEIEELLQTQGAGQEFVSDVALIKQALINERAAPELLMHEAELLHRMKSVVNSQEEIIRGLQNQGAEADLVRSIHIQELNRVKYMLRAYLRCRLVKIEKYVMYILDNEEEQLKLLPQELNYAQEYFILFGRHMKASVLKQLPVEFDGLAKQSNASEVRDMIPEPNLKSYVFCQVLEDCGTIELDDQGTETADFEKDDLYVVQYQSIRERMQGRYVQLI